MFGLSRAERALKILEARRAELVTSIVEHKDAFRPTVGEQHTNGMYDGINFAIAVLRGDD